MFEWLLFNKRMTQFDVSIGLLEESFYCYLNHYYRKMRNGYKLKYVKPYIIITFTNVTSSDKK